MATYTMGVCDRCGAEVCSVEPPITKVLAIKIGVPTYPTKTTSCGYGNLDLQMDLCPGCRTEMVDALRDFFR